MIPKELIEEKLKEEFDSMIWSVVFKHLTLETQEFIKLRFRSSLLSIRQATIEELKSKWYHVGKWHNAECKFLMADEGVCNCLPQMRQKKSQHGF